jgi:protein-tyrosine phosphatase
MKKYILLTLIVLNITNVFAQITDSAKRKVNLQGAINFRDIGGYVTKDGHHVKWGKVYRSADMSNLTDADLAELKRRNITYDVDLRGRQESQQAPDKLNPNTDYILCPAGSDSLVNNITKDIAAHKNSDSIMTAFYSNTNYLTDRYKPFFNKLLIVPDNESLVFHCTAGKDRTGIAAALFLYVLGVPYNTIIADYTATNYYRQSESAKSISSMVQLMRMDEKSAKNLKLAKKEYLDTNFNAIKMRYGSVDNFLRIEIGLNDKEIALLKKKYLN